MPKETIPDTTVTLDEPVGCNNYMDKTTPIIRSSINAEIRSHFPRNVCVQAPISLKIFQIWKLNYAAAKSTVRYTGHFLINYLLEGDLTGPLSVAKTGYVARGNIALLRCNTASLAQTNKNFFFLASHY